MICKNESNQKETYFFSKYLLYFSLYNSANSHIQQQGSSDTNSSQEQTNDLGKFSNQSSYSTVRKFSLKKCLNCIFFSF